MHDDLVFPAGQPQGFSTLATTQWDGNPEPIVRELLQNCLDAAAEKRTDARTDSERAEVEFSIRQVPLARLPGIDSYRRHFEAAVAERAKEEGQGQAEKLVIDRVQQILDEESVRVLCCRDNGVGLNPERMKRLLTEGNTDKGQGGAGAFGIGHLTAFAGSDLRYVLYAGRWGAKEDEVVASGHAILASRSRSDGRGGHGGHGYWLSGLSGDDEPTLFDLQPYPNSAPPLLQEELNRLDGTGSVVCVAGFNDFRSDDDPVRAIASVAAKNFLVAIWRRKMVVRVHGEDGSEAVVGREDLGNVLRRDKARKRARIKGGWIPGAEAYQAWQVLASGTPLELKAGASAHILPLDNAKSRPKSRVQLFRNGMWITNRADQLEPRHFASCKPFAAVVMVEDGELSRLVRGAEGPEHRGLERSRLLKEDSAQLRKLLMGIAAELQAKAGDEEVTGEFTPPGFAMFGGASQRKAERVRRFRPRQGAGSRDATALRRSSKGESVDPRHRKGKGPRRKQGAAPRAGRGAPGRSSARALRNGSGRVDEVRVAWQPPEDGSWSASDVLGVRVRVPSGSDETCESPLAPRWLAIREVRHQGGVIRPKRNDRHEVELSGELRSFTVLLADAAADPNAVEVDLVRRRGSSTSNDGAQDIVL